MTAQANTSPLLGKAGRRVHVSQALKARGNHRSNIWFFDSPKNNSRFEIAGDVAFMHFVLLEGDLSVERYDPQPDPVNTVIDGETRQTKLDAHIYYNDGHIEWWEFKRRTDVGAQRTGRSRPQLSAQAQAAAAAGVPYRVRTDVDLKGHEILFDNWLTLCAAITRCRSQSLHRETDVIAQRFISHREVRFDTLLTVPGIDPACMLAATALALQGGAIEADLDKSLFGLNSILKRSES